MKRALLLFAMVGQLGSGCAQLGGPDGGDANLPTRGINGYEPVTRGNPPSALVLAPDASSLVTYHQPHAVRETDGMSLIFEVRAMGTGHSWIARATSTNGLDFDEPTLVLGSENDLVAYASPSLACGGGICNLLTASPDQSRFYLASGSSVESLTIDDDVTFEITEEYEAGGITHPSIAYDPDSGQFLIAYQVHPSPQRPSELAIATLTASGEVQKRGLLEIERSPCESSMGEPEPCWDKIGRSSPEIRRATTSTERTVWRLSYTGTSPEDSAIGFAAAWDAESFVEFDSNPGFSGQRAEGSNIRLNDSYLLYFVSTSAWGAAGISAAQTTEGFPSDSF